MNILLCGRKGCGKSTATEYLEERFEIEIHRAGEILNNYILSKGKEITHDNRIIYSSLLRDISKTGSLFEFAKVSSDRINVFDSLVYMSDYRSCVSLDSNYLLLAFHSNDNLRFMRINTRGRSDDANISREEIIKMEDSGDIKQIVQLANHDIWNDGDKSDLNNQLEELIRLYNIG